MRAGLDVKRGELSSDVAQLRDIMEALVAARLKLRSSRCCMKNCRRS